MRRRRNPVLAPMLAVLVALAVVIPPTSAWASVRIDASVCEECCAASPGESGCSTVSVCAPAGPEAGVDETPVKPQAAWAAGAIQPAVLRAVPSATWAYVPAGRSAGPPSYLRFGRFLL